MNSFLLRLLAPASVALLALVASLPASAQAPADTLRSVVRRAAGAGWHVRVTTPDETHTARITRVRPDTLMLVGARVALADVASVERRHQEGGGGVVGGLIGGLALGGFGLALAGLCDGDCTGTGLLTGGAGAAVGALLGIVVGQAVVPPRVHWEPLWPAPPAEPR